MGVKFTIVDIGITVTTATVRKDVDEYLKKFKDGDDLQDMPMPENAAEHIRIVTSLQARWSGVKHQLELYQIKNDFLQQLVNLKGSALSGVGYAGPQHQTLQLTLQNDGGRNMGDSYSSTNSQNIAQGKGASASTANSAIQIGSNHNERNERIEALKDFAKEAQQSQLPEPVKAEVGRYIENARDELETSADPKPDEVAKWLDRADKSIGTAQAGVGLAEKFHSLMVLFGLAA